MKQHDKFLDEYFAKHKPKATDSDKTQQFLNVVVWRIMQTVYYTEALIKKLPLDFSLYGDVLSRLHSVLHYEHSLIYLEPLAQQFPDGPRLRELAVFQRQLSNKFFDDADDERGEHFQELSEEALRKSLSLENSFDAHISLAEILIDEKEHLDEAEDHLLQAKAMVTDAADDAHIEMHLGEIAIEQKQYEDALKHFRHVADYQPDSAESFANLAMVYRMLERYEEAEDNYKRAIELEPDNEDYYYILSEMYSANKQPEKAIELLEEGLINNPNSAILHREGGEPGSWCADGADDAPGNRFDETRTSTQYLSINSKTEQTGEKEEEQIIRFNRNLAYLLPAVRQCLPEKPTFAFLASLLLAV